MGFTKNLITLFIHPKSLVLSITKSTSPANPINFETLSHRKNKNIIILGRDLKNFCMS